MEKWGDDQEKKFFIDDTAQALIPFKERHKSLLKLHVQLGEGVSVWKKKKEISSKWKKNVWGGYSESIEILYVFWLSKIA